MMEWKFQTALYALLSGDADLAALGVSIHDDSPQGDQGDRAAEFPRVEIGHIDAREFDTKTEDGLDILLRVHTFSASGSKQEARAIQSRIKALLHRRQADLDLGPEFRLILIRRDASDLERDPGRIRHGVCEYRALIEAL